MIVWIEDNRSRMRSVSEQFGSARLERLAPQRLVRFDPVRSDVDFLADPYGYDASALDRFMGSADTLERVQDREVDLLAMSSLQYPCLISSIEATKVPLHEVARGNATA